MHNNLTRQTGRGSTNFTVLPLTPAIPQTYGLPPSQSVPAVAQSVQTGAQAGTINVPANQEWTDTGLLVSQGAQIQITATGLAHPCMYNNCVDKRYQQWVGPEGFVNLPRLQQNSLPDMALIAKIGTSGPVYIGRDRSLTAFMDGNLYLGVNDASNLSDNAGSFAATIRIGESTSETPVSSPPTEGTNQGQAESEQSPNDPQPQTSLQPIDCREEKNFRSKQSATPSIVKFENNTYDNVRIYWINQSGNRVFYKAVAPSEAYAQDTFLTHPWVATDSQNRCLGIFLPEYGTRRAIVKMRP